MVVIIKKDIDLDLYEKVKKNLQNVFGCIIDEDLIIRSSDYNFFTVDDEQRIKIKEKLSKNPVITEQLSSIKLALSSGEKEIIISYNLHPLFEKCIVRRVIDPNDIHNTLNMYTILELEEDPLNEQEFLF